MTAAATTTAASAARIDTRPLKIGLLGALVVVFSGGVGMLESFQNRFIVRPLFTLSQVLLFVIPLAIGYFAARRKEVPGAEPIPPRAMDLVGGLVAGVITGVGAGLMAAVVASNPGIRRTFPHFSPSFVETITLGRGVGGGILMLGLLAGIVGLAGAALHRLPPPLRRGLAIAAQLVVFVPIFEPVVRDLFRSFPAVTRTIFATGGGLALTSAIGLFVLGGALGMFLPGRVPSLRKTILADDPAERRRNSIIAAVIVAAVMLVLPQLLGGVMNELITNVGLFLLMGLGLNIVVGSAGLLDLGYVAFFAVGAYTTAVLTSPLSPFFTPELSWWMAFPFVLVMAGIAGIMVGTPVIRMRGDYLAIVTLGFGEIVRITLLSDWLAPYFGGAQGIRRIPGIPVGETVISGTDPKLMLYTVLVFVAISAYISWRLQDSRIGRAWAAMREDEDVAEAIGVDTVKAKLLAFVSGAVLASFAGALFAAKVGSVFTHSFEILVSIIILVIVIVGGMGNIAGVAVGAFVLIGILGGPKQPGLLQELGEFKLLIYGALLVYMMLKKPEGLLPSARRAQELHQEEFLQDAWLEKQGRFVETGEES